MHRAILNYNFLKGFFDYKLKYTPKVLDYGGSAGYMLIPFIKNFDCYLIDYIEYKLPRGIQYLGRNSNDLKHDIRFDIIFLIRVLEHINDPRNLIEDLIQNLNPNGILYIQVPLGCLKEWKSLDTPFRHINFFSEQSLYNCLRIAGLNIIYLNTVYQKIGGNPGWKIDIIGMKKSQYHKQKKILFKSTNLQQRLKFFYYIPFFVRNKKYKYKIIISKLNRLKKNISKKLS